MVTLEVHPGQGGADAEEFAAQLAGAIGRHFNVPVDRVGRVSRLHRL